jgi:predicted amidophosphoribosyltransferase
MKNRSRELSCCTSCGRDTLNKSKICKRCVNGEDADNPRLLREQTDEQGERDPFYGFSFVSRAWGGFTHR